MDKKILILAITISFMISLSYQQVQAVDVVNLSGHIEDENGNPVITDVNLKRIDPPGGVTTVTTNSNGDYSLDVLAGSYELVLTNFGSQPNAPSSYNIRIPIMLTEDTIHDDIVFPLVTLSGTVRDSTLQPVEGVRINARIENAVFFDGFSGDVVGVGITDVNGFYSEILFPQSVDIVEVTPPPAEGPQFVLPGLDVFSDTTLDIILEPFVNLSGHIEDENGNPVITDVNLKRIDPPGGVTTVTTNSNGDYSLDVLAGSYELVLTNFGSQPNAPSSYNIRIPIMLTEDTIHDDIVFPLVTLSGIVRGFDCQPVEGVRINARIENAVFFDGFSGDVVGVGITDVNGFYSEILFPQSVDIVEVTPPPAEGPQFVLPGLDVFSDTTLVIEFGEPCSFPIGGEIIPLDTSALLVAGAQMNASWMIPVVLSGIGIGLFVFRKSENS